MSEHGKDFGKMRTQDKEGVTGNQRPDFINCHFASAALLVGHSSDQRRPPYPLSFATVFMS